LPNHIEPLLHDLKTSSQKLEARRVKDMKLAVKSRQARLDLTKSSASGKFTPAKKVTKTKVAGLSQEVAAESVFFRGGNSSFSCESSTLNL
jgi:hypothetical protein